MAVDPANSANSWDTLLNSLVRGQITMVSLESRSLL
jgi:hypothetical protein